MEIPTHNRKPPIYHESGLQGNDVVKPRARKRIIYTCIKHILTENILAKFIYQSVDCHIASGSINNRSKATVFLNYGASMFEQCICKVLAFCNYIPQRERHWLITPPMNDLETRSAKHTSYRAVWVSVWHNIGQKTLIIRSQEYWMAQTESPVTLCA